MKKIITITIVAVTLALILVCLAMIVIGVNRSAWTQNAERNIHGAEIIVQTYKREFGANPKSLKEAFDWMPNSSSTNVATLLGCPNCYYEYQATSNRFSIAVVRRSTWYCPEWKVRREYQFEAN